MTYAEAAATLRSEGAYYTDPIMVAVADGNWNAQHNPTMNEFEYRGIVVGGKYFKSEAIRIAYRNGFAEGSKRATKRRKRGW